MVDDGDARVRILLAHDCCLCIRLITYVRTYVCTYVYACIAHYCCYITDASAAAAAASAVNCCRCFPYAMETDNQPTNQPTNQPSNQIRIAYFLLLRIRIYGAHDCYSTRKHFLLR